MLGIMLSVLGSRHITLSPRCCLPLVVAFFRKSRNPCRIAVMVCNRYHGTRHLRAHTLSNELFTLKQCQHHPHQMLA